MVEDSLAIGVATLDVWLAGAGAAQDQLQDRVVGGLGGDVEDSVALVGCKLGALVDEEREVVDVHAAEEELHEEGAVEGRVPEIDAGSAVEKVLHQRLFPAVRTPVPEPDISGRAWTKDGGAEMGRRALWDGWEGGRDGASRDVRARWREELWIAHCGTF